MYTHTYILYCGCEFVGGHCTCAKVKGCCGLWLVPSVMLVLTTELRSPGLAFAFMLSLSFCPFSCLSPPLHPTWLLVLSVAFLFFLSHFPGTQVFQVWSSAAMKPYHRETKRSMGSS